MDWNCSIWYIYITRKCQTKYDSPQVGSFLSYFSFCQSYNHQWEVISDQLKQNTRTIFLVTLENLCLSPSIYQLKNMTRKALSLPPSNSTGIIQTFPIFQFTWPYQLNQAWDFKNKFINTYIYIKNKNSNGQYLS